MNGLVMRNDLARALALLSERERKRRADAACTGKGKPPYEPQQPPKFDPQHSIRGVGTRKGAEG